MEIEPTSESRKSAHLDLAQQAQGHMLVLDRRFDYEPLLAGHLDFADYPKHLSCTFLGKTLRAPIWVSSMTGGVGAAGHINRNLARAVKEFGLGMGLGSCRPLLDSSLYFADFNLRPLLGDDRPLFANLGIAQVGELLRGKQIGKLKNLMAKLNADGLIVHINPLQEALQPEGDRWTAAPLAILTHLLAEVTFPIIVKEVGQGMGPASLAALFAYPWAAVELAAYGGTNFAKLELIRQTDSNVQKDFGPLAQVGHDAQEMVQMLCQLASRENLAAAGGRPAVIVSGGIQNFLDGYYYCQQLAASGYQAIYGQARALLEYAQQDYPMLQGHLQRQISGLLLAKSLLRLRLP